MIKLSLWQRRREERHIKFGIHMDTCSFLRVGHTAARGTDENSDRPGPRKKWGLIQLVYAFYAGGRRHILCRRGKVKGGNTYESILHPKKLSCPKLQKRGHDLFSRMLLGEWKKPGGEASLINLYREKKHVLNII